MDKKTDGLTNRGLSMRRYNPAFKKLVNFLMVRASGKDAPKHGTQCK
jgi:hypothetical protein